MASHDSAEYNHVHFVYYAEGTHEKSVHDDHLARSHTAKVNRSKTRRTTTLRSPSTRSPSTVPRKQISLLQCQSSWKIRVAPKAAAPRTCVTRTLSPVFGAFPAATFAPGIDRREGETIAYYCRFVLKNNTSSNEVQWFIQAYCEYAVVFHALHYAVANHQDRLHGYVSKTNSAGIIAHKLQALRLMSQAINAYCSGNMPVGPLLFAVTAVMRNEPDAGQLIPDPMLLFRPYMPNVNNVAIYGRGRAVQTASVHCSIISHLLTRTEQTLAVSAPGLAKAIAGFVITVQRTDLTADILCKTPPDRCQQGAR
ncbi:hypothetical protein LTR56_010298 [Elasticomyces elasticus]|nr:hypothetical protein LTR56_010298 [Elasticomyces elasticus]KAK4922975.1 hypothetical protein LTR49_009806 [Elasticomyces elasticus]